MDTDTESHTESLPLKLTKSPTSLKDPSAGKINHSSLTNLQIHTPAQILQTMDGSWAVNFYSTPSSSYAAMPPGKKKEKKTLKSHIHI